MKPLCYKKYSYKIAEIIVFIICLIFNFFFWLKKDESKFVFFFACIFSIVLLYLLIGILYWVFQPHVLIYQYETGIIIKKNTKVEYKEIEMVYYKNYLHKKWKYGPCYRNKHIGTIYIILKSGKKYKFLNVADPINVIYFFKKIKKNKKFR